MSRLLIIPLAIILFAIFVGLTISARDQNEETIQPSFFSSNHSSFDNETKDTDSSKKIPFNLTKLFPQKKPSFDFQKCLKTELNSFNYPAKWYPIYPTGSMFCFEGVTELLIISKEFYPYEKLQLGDVVWMKAINVPVYVDKQGEVHEINSLIHRIVANSSQGFITKGDNLSMTDVELYNPYLTKETYLGVPIAQR